MKKTLLMIAVLVLALGLVYALGEDKVEQQILPEATNPALTQQEAETPPAQAPAITTAPEPETVVKSDIVMKKAEKSEKPMEAQPKNFVAVNRDGEKFVKGNGQEVPVTLDAPPNDLCEDAELITGPYPVSGSGTCIEATVDCPTTLNWEGVWYEITLPYDYNNITIEVCGTSVELYNTGIVLMDDCACDDYILATYTWDATQCATGYGVTLEFYDISNAGGTIWWPALEQDVSYTGIDFDYTISITEGVAPTGRCCYDDIYAPLCVDGVTEDECTTTYSGFDWVANETCASLPCQPACMEDSITLVLYTDAYPSETTWDISENGNPGNIIASGGPYTYGYTYYTEKVCIDYNTCWDVNLYDSYGDGGASYEIYYNETLERTGVITGYGQTEYAIGGGCAALTGACCYGDPTAPTCVDEVTEDDCYAIYDGYSWVLNASCTDDPTPCPALVQGDECGYPYEITALPFDDTGNSCNFNNSCSGSNASQDVIYELDLSGETDPLYLQVSLCGSSFDTYLRVYQNDCCSGTPWMYNDDYCSVQSQIEAEFAPAVYYIVVEGYSSYCGDYVLYVGEPPTGRCCDYSVDPQDPTCTDGVVESNCQGTGQTWDEGLFCDTDPCPLPPANDLCDDAEVLTGGSPYMGEASTFLTQNVECPGLLNWDNTIWYEFEIPYDLNYITITICGVTENLQNTGLVLMNDCLCDDYILDTDYAYITCDNGYQGVRLHWNALPGAPGTMIYWPAMAENTSYGPMDFSYVIEVNPPPTGRCCDYSVDPDNPVCTDDVTEADCALADMYWAQDLNCDDNPCPTTPANDLCEDAEAITGPYPATGTGSTFMATMDCPDVLGWNAVWYTVDLPYEYNHVTFTICAMSADIATAGWVIMDDCTCAGYTLRDNYAWLTEDDCDFGHNGFQFEFYGLPAGTIYWPAYFVDANTNGLEFSYTVDVEEFILPANDLCENAIAVDIPSETIGYTLGATLDIVPGAYCGTTVTAPGVWYSLTGNGNTVTVSTCNAYTTYDTKISVFCAGCGGLACVGGNDDNCPEYTYRSSYSFCTEAETEYLVLVHGFSAAIGDFQLDVIDGTECSSPPDCIAPVGSCCYGDFYNQQCADAVTIGECIDLDGISWMQDGTCELNPCPTYAHCTLDPGFMEGEVDTAGPGNTDSGVITIGNDGSGALTFTTSVSLDPPPVSSSIGIAEPAKPSQLSVAGTLAEKNANIGPTPNPNPNVILQGGDNCSDYFDLGSTVPASDAGSTTGYTNDYGPYGTQPDCWEGFFSGTSSGAGPDVTYKFTAPADSIYVISLCGSAYDTGLELYDFTCPSEPVYPDNFICGNDDFCGLQSELSDIALSEGQEILIVVDGYGSSSGSYTLSVDYVLPPPTGRCCDYLDPFNIVCTDGVLQGDCAGTAQVWTEGLNCTDNPCEPLPGCDEGSLYSQDPPNMPWEAWSFATSDDSLGPYLCVENYAGVFGTIEGIKFWGLDLVYVAGFTECDMITPDFNISFYEDAGGVPGDLVASYAVTATITGTGIFFSDTYEMKEFEVSFDPVELGEGWVGIQSRSETNECQFLWAAELDNPVGDNNSIQYQAGTPVALGYDLAFCLTGTYVAPWLTVDVDGGTIDPGEPAMDITVTMDAATLECHENPYTGRVNFYTNDPQNLSMTVPVDFTVCGPQGFQYVPGDANMIVGSWKPLVIGGDVTYLVGYFRGINPPCLLGDPGFFCSADVNGDCLIIGSDVTKMVTYFRGMTTLTFCADYPPLWPTPGDAPDTAPPGWPPCETPSTAGKVLPSTPTK